MLKEFGSDDYDNLDVGMTKAEIIFLIKKKKEFLKKCSKENYISIRKLEPDDVRGAEGMHLETWAVVNSTNIVGENKIDCSGTGSGRPKRNIRSYQERYPDFV